MTLLEHAGLRRIEPPRATRVEDLPQDRAEDLRELFARWGGDLSMFTRLRPGGWDLAFEGGLVVELDEQQHFNRYRKDTLTWSWAATLPWVEPYSVYCQEFEYECLRFGKGQGRWTNPSSERFFGMGREPGDFEGVGSPRWRQRAFYDAVRDAVPSSGLARLAVHDQLGEETVETVLRSHDLSVAGDLLNILRARSS